ncbi:Pre-mRNA-processing ATP-dependent RNA helicase PRP5, partial [Nosema granulosis]
MENEKLTNNERNSPTNSERFEVDGLSVYVENYKSSDSKYSRNGFNRIQEICLDSVMQGKDLLCRSIVLHKDTNTNKISPQVSTWIACVSAFRGRVLVLVSNKDTGEAVKKEFKKSRLVFHKYEENLENVEVVISSPVYAHNLLSQNNKFGMLVVDEGLKFHESGYFRMVYEIRRLLEPETQVVIFSPIYSRENFSGIMKEERVVVEVESMPSVEQEVVECGKNVYERAVEIIKDGNFHFKSSWRNQVEIDKIVIVVRDRKIEKYLERSKIPFRSLEKNKEMKEGVLDKFRGGAFPVLVVDRYLCRAVDLSKISLCISLDYSDSIRDYLFRSTLLKPQAKLVTFVSEENSPRFLEDLISTLEVNKVEVPSFIRNLKKNKSRSRNKEKQNLEED